MFSSRVKNWPDNDGVKVNPINCRLQCFCSCKWTEKVNKGGKNVGNYTISATFSYWNLETLRKRLCASAFTHTRLGVVPRPAVPARTSSQQTHMGVSAERAKRISKAEAASCYAWAEPLCRLHCKEQSRRRLETQP